MERVSRSRWISTVGLVAIFVGLNLHGVSAKEDDRTCISCHEKIQASLVVSWRESPMARQGVTCIDCHGSFHKSAEDAVRASLMVGRLCEKCHPTEMAQFKSGKHAQAWVSVNRVTKVLELPLEMIDAEEGCGGCHAIGREDGQCDSCHTRHSFSKEEARKPEACLPCHGGINHPQWEIWRSSKHGVVYRLDPKKERGPTCQTCHFHRGDHGVKTAWSLLALRLPGADREWIGYRKTILLWLGLIDKEGNPTALLTELQAKGIIHVKPEEWAQFRKEMVEICGKCHGRFFAQEKLSQRDAIVKETDKLMADAIQIVETLYQKSILARPEIRPISPDLLGLYSPPNPLEEKLWEMFLRHRIILLHGAFHNNPDFTSNHGWVKLKAAYGDVKRMAQEFMQAGVK
jgi:hydroxylamine dehydrogenase